MSQLSLEITDKARKKLADLGNEAVISVATVGTG